jgi:hypothetical protein
MPEIYLPKAPVATSWVTVADLSGTGTTVLTSAQFNLLPNDLPDCYDVEIEVQYTVTKTGGTGQAHSWIRMPVNLFNTPLTNTGAEGVDQFTALVGTVTSTTYKTRLKPTILQSSGVNWSLSGQFAMQVRVKGQNADTAFTVSNIRARFIYVPL